MKTKLPLLTLFLTTFICITSCTKDTSKEPSQSASLNKTSITLYVDETSMLKYSGGDCKWSTDNLLVAEVDEGLVTAKHVGTTIIRANNLTCTVTVKPRYSSYVEPYMVWGSSKSTVKSVMSGYTIRQDNNTSLIYEGKGRVDAYGYTFENGKLKNSSFYSSLSNSTTLTDFLLERYWVIDIEKIGTNEYISYLGSVDLKNYICLSISTSGCIVIYYDADSLKNKQ